MPSCTHGMDGGLRNYFDASRDAATSYADGARGMAGGSTESDYARLGASGGLGTGISIGMGRDAVERALLDRLNKEAELDRSKYDSIMSARGLQGSTLEQEGQEVYDRGLNDRRASAILAAGQEHSRLLGEARAEGVHRRQGISWVTT